VPYAEWHTSLQTYDVMAFNSVMDSCGSLKSDLQSMSGNSFLPGRRSCSSSVIIHIGLPLNGGSLTTLEAGPSARPAGCLAAWSPSGCWHAAVRPFVTCSL